MLGIIAYNLAAALCDAQRLRARRPQDVVDETILLGLHGVEVLVPVEVPLDLRGRRAGQAVSEELRVQGLQIQALTCPCF